MAVAVVGAAAAIGAGLGWVLRWVAWNLPLLLIRAEEQEAREVLDQEEEPGGDESFPAFPSDSAIPGGWGLGVGGALVWGLAAGTAAGWGQAAMVAGVGSLLLLLAVIDARDQLLPDVLVLPLLWGGLLAAALTPWGDPTEAILGAAAGYGTLAGVATVYRWWRQREGLGAGDWKLVAALGAWLGWQPLPLVVAAAVGLALGASLVQMLKGRATLTSPLAFGPFLALAGWGALVIKGMM